MKCSVCRQPAARLCGACHFVPYCGESCASADWKVHGIEAHVRIEEEDEHDIDQVWPGIWIGGVAALRTLDQHGIAAVVTALPRDRHVDDSVLEERVGGRPWFRVYWYDSPDQELPRAELEAAADFIDRYRNQKGGVLVHCWAGHSRSVTIVLFYLLTRTGQFARVQDALAHVRKTRTFADPNEGFLEQLERLWKTARR